MMMEKKKKTDLKKVVKESRSKKADQDSVSDFEVRTVKPIVESKNKTKKPKEKIEDDKKPTGEKKQKEQKAGIRKEPEKTNNKNHPGQEPGSGGKAEVSRAPAKRRKRSLLPPWWDWDR